MRTLCQCFWLFFEEIQLTGDKPCNYFIKLICVETAFYKTLMNPPAQGMLSPHLNDTLKNLCMQLPGQHKGTTELQMHHVF